MLKELLPTGRWRLLRVLWVNDEEGSILALSRLADVNYSSAHNELRLFEKAGLARSKRIGNSQIYQANRGHPQASELETILRASADSVPQSRPRPRRSEVLAQVKKLGAPVHADSSPETEMSAEEAVALALQLSHREPSLARALPVLLTRCRDRLDLVRLELKARALNEKQTLGFFLDLTGRLANDRTLRSRALALKDRRVRKTKDFFVTPRGPRAVRLAELRTPAVAKDWSFRMDMSMEDFEQLYRKFCGDS